MTGRDEGIPFKAPAHASPACGHLQLHDLTSNGHHMHSSFIHGTSRHPSYHLEPQFAHIITTMATSTLDQPITNGVHPTPSKPLELAFTLPSNPHTKLHIQLTVHATTVLLFVTTTTPENSSQATPLGSFVYALPDRYNPSQPLSTPVYSITHTLDFTQRLAKLLARKTGRACYVGNSASFRDSVQGGTVEEEMEAFGAIVKVVMGEIGKAEG